MIDRWVANGNVKGEPVEFYHLHQMIDNFNSHFPKDANRVEMSVDRWNRVQIESPVPAFDFKDAENRLGVELVLDHEMNDDLIRVVSEWKYDE